MNKTLKLVFLVILTVFILFLTVKQSIKFYHSIKSVELPTQQSRELSNLGVFNTMSVKELSLKYNVKEDVIFNFLKIIPEQNDASLSLKELRKKYNKAPEEFRDGLKLLIDSSSKAGAKNE